MNTFPIVLLVDAKRKDMLHLTLLEDRLLLYVFVLAQRKKVFEEYGVLDRL